MSSILYVYMAIIFLKLKQICYAIAYLRAYKIRKHQIYIGLVWEINSLVD
jgi:hypothetical protein